MEQLDVYCLSLFVEHDNSGRIRKIRNPRNPGISISTKFSNGMSLKPCSIEIAYVSKNILAVSDSSIPTEAFTTLQADVVSSEHQLNTVSSKIILNNMLDPSI